MNVKNPKKQTIEKMKKIHYFKGERYTYRAIAEMFKHSETYVKELHIFYKNNILNK